VKIGSTEFYGRIFAHTKEEGRDCPVSFRVPGRSRRQGRTSTISLVAQLQDGTSRPATPDEIAVILAHPHPSGVAEPSQADELITQHLKDALRSSITSSSPAVTQPASLNVELFDMWSAGGGTASCGHHRPFLLHILIVHLVAYCLPATAAEGTMTAISI
jgi:hypothetical protein